MDITFVIDAGDEKGGEIRYDPRTDLLFMYGPAVCAQWDCKHVGVELMLLSDAVLKMAFLSMGVANGYQSFYIKADRAKQLTAFFRQLGFPVPDMPDYSAKTSNKRE